MEDNGEKIKGMSSRLVTTEESSTTEKKGFSSERISLILVSGEGTTVETGEAARERREFLRLKNQKRVKRADAF